MEQLDTSWDDVVQALVLSLANFMRRFFCLRYAFFKMQRRNQSARFTHVYLSAVKALRNKEFKPKDIVPLEYFEFERVFVDEIHESLCTSKNEMQSALLKEKATKGTEKDFFREKNRRAGRELLGLVEKDVRKRPIIYRKGIFGLT